MNYRYNAGDRILSRYVVQHGVGVGGFGEVYFAVSDAGKEVALKSVQRNLEVELRGVSHCLNLKHQNLVALHDICTDTDQQPWVVMEYVSGSNLRDVLLEAPNGLPLSEVQRWITGVLYGVRHLHQAGIVHRDLKPENIFDDDGVIKVGDYGLSTLDQFGDVRQTEGVGTVHYMAPEVGRGEYGPSVDIYAIGIILHELLTGRVPLDGETKNEVMMKHLTSEPNLDKVPLLLRHIVEKCLRKDRRRRYQNLNEIIEQFVCVTDESNQIPVAELVCETSESDQIPVAELLADNEKREDTQCGKKTIGGKRVSLSGSRSPNFELDPLTRVIFFPNWIYVAVAVVTFGSLFLNPQSLSLASLVLVIIIPVWLVSRQSQKRRFQKQMMSRLAEPVTRRLLPYKVNTQKWKAAVRSLYNERSTLRRSCDWLQASIVVILLAFAFGMIFFSIQNPNLSFESSEIAPFVWATTLVSIAAMGFLGMTEYWPTQVEEDFSDRVMPAIFGALVGIFAFFLHDYLLLSNDFSFLRDFGSKLSGVSHPQETPTGLAFVAHFSLLFFVVRWHRLCDPIRKKKLSLWGILVVIIVEWCLHQIFPLGQPAGIAFAGALVIVLQIAAPWIPTSQRPNYLSAMQSSSDQVNE